MSRKPDTSTLGKERRDKIITFMFRFFSDNDYYPSIREIGETVGISSTSVTNYYIDRLELAGFIDHQRKISRGLSLTSAGKYRAMTLLKMPVKNICPHCGMPLPIEKGRGSAPKQKIQMIAGVTQ